jgi:hypothetical protein
MIKEEEEKEEEINPPNSNDDKKSEIKPKDPLINNLLSQKPENFSEQQFIHYPYLQFSKEKLKTGEL